MSRRDAVKSRWKVKLDLWRNSGLSGKAWCRQNQISYATFRYWRRKFDVTKVSRDQSKALFQFGSFDELIEPSKNITPIEVECHGAIMRLTKDFDEAIFKRCVRLLKEI